MFVYVYGKIETFYFPFPIMCLTVEMFELVNRSHKMIYNSE